MSDTKAGRLEKEGYGIDMELRVKFEDSGVQQLLAALANRAADNAGILRKVATIYLSSTEKRFETSTAPSGRSWKRNSKATTQLKLKGMKGRSPAILGAKPGVWSGKLASSMKYRIVGDYLCLLYTSPSPRD